MDYHHVRFFVRNIFVFVITCSVAAFSSGSIQQDLNDYFAGIDTTLSTLQRSQALRSTERRPAENLFIRELKRNQSYYAFWRVNSKGKIVSEVIRGKNPARPGTDVENENWFKSVKKNNEDFYTVFKDEERGRYYLIWSKPVLKNDKFVGAVCLKIDLWDSFYEYSNGVYFPFSIKLGKKTLFSHKWKDQMTYQEDNLIVPGIKSISVRYIPEKKDASPDTIANAQNETSDTALSTTDSIKTADVSSQPAKKKKYSSGVLLLIIALVATCGVIAYLFISKMRKDAILKKIEEDDF
jgi:hypothetical protein